MSHTELDLHERRAIEDKLNAKMPNSLIAVKLGRHRSSVYREKKRNGFVDDEFQYLNGYYRLIAHKAAGKRRVRCRKLI